MQLGAIHAHSGAPAGLWLPESRINSRMSPCIGKMYSFAQMCLERKSLFDCARQSFKVMTADNVQDQICSPYTVCVSAAPGRRGGGFQSSGVPTEQRPPYGWGLGSAMWGVWFVCPQIWTHEVELGICYISMSSQDCPLRTVEMSSVSLPAVLQRLQGVGKVLSDHISCRQLRSPGLPREVDGGCPDFIVICSPSLKCGCPVETFGDSLMGFRPELVLPCFCVLKWGTKMDYQDL